MASCGRDPVEAGKHITVNFTKILVPIDYSNCSDRALQWGASLAEKYGARLLLLHVIGRASKDLPEAEDAETPLPLALDNPSVYYTRGPLAPEGMTAIDLIEVAQNDLKDLAMATLNEGLAVSQTVGVGNPAEEILRVAQEEAVDLIVMGTHGRTGLRHVLMGSVAEAVVRAAPCPVFTVRAAIRVAP